MRTVTIYYHAEREGWWADSPDAIGWSAGGESWGEVRSMAEEGLRFYLDDEDLDIRHIPQGDFARSPTMGVASEVNWSPLVITREPVETTEPSATSGSEGAGTIT
jgi:predicted RNase H-like HicB family nuclease